MNKPDMEDVKKTLNRTGLIHIAFSVGSKEKVDELTMKLEEAGYFIIEDREKNRRYSIITL